MVVWATSSKETGTHTSAAPQEKGQGKLDVCISQDFLSFIVSSVSVLSSSPLSSQHLQYPDTQSVLHGQIFAIKIAAGLAITAIKQHK